MCESSILPHGRTQLASLLAFLFWLPIAGYAQTPIKVELCDLVKEPQKYNRQWVQVRGAVEIAFEDFTLQTSQCEGEHRWVWLMYGGDESTPVISTWNDHDRKPGGVIKVEGIPVPLQRDATLEKFKSRLHARRMKAPDGSQCDQECLLYEVTATFTGLFMAAPEDRRSLRGYGHLGCCHLLTIERVREVEAERTPVPAGGRFACSTNAWEMNAAEAAQFEQGAPCAELEECNKTASRRFHMVAQHWGDKLDGERDGWGFIGRDDWHSRDLLTNYVVQVHYEKERRQAGNITGATATRTICHAVEAPYPKDTPVGCKSFLSDFNADKKHQDPRATWSGDPVSVAWSALAEAARRWNIQLLPQLALQKCDKPETVEGEQFTWCQFAEPTSMQGLEIELTRRRPFLRARKDVPWTLAGGDGISCEAEEAHKTQQ